MNAANTSLRRTVRSGRRWACVAALAATALVAACSDEQRRALGEEDVRTSLADHVTAAIESAGLTLDGDLECTATIAVAGTVTAECTGSTDTGAAVTGAYSGTADIDAERCTADLATSIADQHPADQRDVDCFGTR